jgi:hypothetical protein
MTDARDAIHPGPKDVAPILNYFNGASIADQGLTIHLTATTRQRSSSCLHAGRGAAMGRPLDDLPGSRSGTSPQGLDSQSVRNVGVAMVWCDRVDRVAVVNLVFVAGLHLMLGGTLKFETPSIVEIGT